MKKKINFSNLKNSIYLTAAGLAFTGFVSFGILPSIHYIPTIKQGEIKMKKMYSPLSYLELTIEKEKPKRIYQKSSLTKNIILGFDLNYQGKVERMIDDSSLWEELKLRISSPEEYKTIDWPAVNQTAQRYIAYFQEK